MKRISQLFLVGLMVIFAGTAMAGPWSRGMGQGYGMGPYSYDAANLTADQTAQLQTLRESFLKEVSPLQSEMFAKRSEMRTLWAASNPNEGNISTLQKDLLELQGKMQERRLQFNLECRKIINP
jgi:Spy/CpxP family protein refolding chaperone